MKEKHLSDYDILDAARAATPQSFAFGGLLVLATSERWPHLLALNAK